MCRLSHSSLQAAIHEIHYSRPNSQGSISWQGSADWCQRHAFNIVRSHYLVTPVVRELLRNSVAMQLVGSSCASTTVKPAASMSSSICWMSQCLSGAGMLTGNPPRWSLPSIYDAVGLYSLFPADHCIYIVIHLTCQLF